MSECAKWETTKQQIIWFNDKHVHCHNLPLWNTHARAYHDLRLLANKSFWFRAQVRWSLCCCSRWKKASKTFEVFFFVITDLSNMGQFKCLADRKRVQKWVCEGMTDDSNVYWNCQPIDNRLFRQTTKWLENVSKNGRLSE